MAKDAQCKYNLSMAALSLISFSLLKVDSDIKVHTSLPPFVPGEVRGTIHVRFPVMKWDCATPPPAPRLNVHLKWWGEETEGCVFR